MSLELMFGLWVAAAVSGIVPLVNAEVVVAGAAAALPAITIPILAVVVGSGQMATKGVLYGLARWTPSKLPTKAQARIEQACRRMGEHGGAVDFTLLASASTGVPPFYGVSLAAGALRVGFVRFFVLGLIGRILRFAVVAWAANEAGRALFSGLADSAGLFLPG
ncbi:MAG: hypothetical protein OEN56_13185 [Gemmatimonadota bacterium]|nr:hypothetical protein [Gemmatimonadota bacterium]